MEEELKNKNAKVEKVAGEENKDKDSLAYDQNSHRLIDIDDILLGDFKIAQKFNNLSEYGVTTEQVKKMYEMSGDISSEQSLEDILKELEKVFAKLVSKINSNSNIGIVIDFNSGKEDVGLSKIKCIDLGIEYETFEKKSTEEQKTIMEIIKSAVEPKEEKILQEFNANIKKDNFYDFFKDYFEPSEKDIKEAQESLGISLEEMTKMEKISEFVLFKDKYEANIIRALYEYKNSISENPDPEKVRKAKERLEKVLKEQPNTRYAEYLFDENQNVDFDKAIDFLNDWEDKTNLSNTYNQAISLISSHKNEKINFNDIKDDAIKKSICLLLLRTKKYIDNDNVRKAREGLLEKFDLEKLSEEELLERINLILFGTRDEVSAEDYEKIISAEEFNSKTYNLRIMKESWRLGDKKSAGKSYFQVTNILSPENTFDSLEERTIFEIVSSDKGKKIGNEKELKGLEIINLYNSYYARDGKNSYVIKHLNVYIEKNREYFEEYFTKMGEEGIFNKNGSVSITRIQEILGRQYIDKRIEEDTESIMKEIDDKRKYIAEVREGVKTYIDELSQLKIKKNKLDEEKENRVLEILDSIDLSALDEELIKKLKSYESDKINNKLDQVLKTYDGMTKLLTRNMNRITKEDAMVENLLLLEARLEYSKGTADYENNLKDMNEYLEKHPESAKYTQIYRDSEGNLTNNGKKGIRYYVNSLFHETIKYNIEQTDISTLDGNGRRIFATMLIAGMENDDIANNVSAIETLKKIFPRYADIEDRDLLLKNVYSIVYGKEVANNPDEIEKRKREIKKNLIVKILKKKELHDLSNFTKVKDEEFFAIFERTAVPLEISQMDLTKSEMQSKFEGSEIEYSDENDATYKELYSETTVNSWISSKKDLATYEIALLLAKDIKNSGKDILTDSSIKYISSRLDRLYRKHPDLKEKFENDKEFRETAIENVKTFEKNKTISDLLEYYQKDILVNAKDYNKLTLSNKKDIFRYALFANKFSETLEDPKAKELFHKLSNRAFELMNSDERTYITFDENGNGILNEKNILEEANEIFKEKVNWKDFNGLAEHIKKRQELLYVPLKLFTYSAIKDDKYFETLKEGTSDEKLAQIQEKNMFRVTKREFSSKFRNESKEVNEIQAVDEHYIQRENQNREDENQSEYKKESIEASNITTVDVEDIKTGELNTKVSFVDKIKNVINKFRQPKLSDGTNSLENKNGILANLALKVKNMFSKGGKKENLKNDNITIENARNSQIEYSNSQKDFNQRMQVQNYDYQSALDKTNKSKRMEKVQSEDKDFGGI